MCQDVVLITNNPYFQQFIDPSSLQFLDGTSLDVLIAVRDAIHMGSSLLTHPLYGNLRPNQQPFRSILLRNAALLQNTAQNSHKVQKERNFNSSSYLESISSIEEAVLLYRSYGGRLSAPENLPDAAREDYSFVDSELMRESLTLYKLWPRRRV